MSVAPGYCACGMPSAINSALCDRCYRLLFPEPVTVAPPGMALRDWFAGQALAVAITQLFDPTNNAAMAGNCYNIADAMLAARAKDRP